MAAITLCVSPQGRPGTDGGRGAPGETGAKVSFIQQLFQLECYTATMLFNLFMVRFIIAGTDSVSHRQLCSSLNWRVY